MRTPIIAGNWKMNTTLSQAVALVKEMRERLDKVQGVEKVVCPPSISLAAVNDVLKGTSIGLGAQNMHFEEKGAFTGEIAPTMLVDLCPYVILGHSERRQYFCETDAIVNKKIKAALKAGLKPILCVGEKLEEREAGKAVSAVTGQVKGSLADVPAPANLVVAYEPIWAIGAGRAATAKDANDMIGTIREVVSGLYGKDFANNLRIQYGGSVTAANVAELISQPEIDGGLVGGASLKASEFVSIVEQTAVVKKPK
ncbi:MAG: triose-phosphate isomerase [Chloroflexi bacterium]|nr:triose-phosphate isomerase [Chloroflexota bacterium]